MADPINLTQVLADADKDVFWAVRGKAIQAYASVEQSLCGLFAHLLERQGTLPASSFLRLSTLARCTASWKNLSGRSMGTPTRYFGIHF